MVFTLTIQSCIKEISMASNLKMSSPSVYFHVYISSQILTTLGLTLLFPDVSPKQCLTLAFQTETQS